MKRFVVFCLALGLALPMVVGCEKSSTATKETKITTPEGTTKVTDTEKVEQSGKNPPAANQ